MRKNSSSIRTPIMKLTVAYNSLRISPNPYVRDLYMAIKYHPAAKFVLVAQLFGTMYQVHKLAKSVPQARRDVTEDVLFTLDNIHFDITGEQTTPTPSLPTLEQLSPKHRNQYTSGRASPYHQVLSP